MSTITFIIVAIIAILIFAVVGKILDAKKKPVGHADCPEQCREGFRWNPETKMCDLISNEDFDITVLFTETPDNSDYIVAFDPITPTDGKSLNVELPYFGEPFNIEQKADTPANFNNVWYINRSGKRWEQEEIEYYRNAHRLGKSLEEISHVSGRSIASLKEKLGL